MCDSIFIAKLNDYRGSYAPWRFSAGWSSQPAVFLDCFVASLLAMTAIGRQFPIGSG